MESQKIKDNRRAKFLAKLESQNKANKRDKPKKVSSTPSTNNSQPTSSQNNFMPQQSNIQSNPSTNFSPTQTNQSINNNLNDFNINNMMNNISSLNNLLNPNMMMNKMMNNNQQKNLFNNNNTNTNTNNGNNEFISNNKSEQKFNYNEILGQLNQFDYMINFQSIIKKILIIILSIIHCLKYPPLDNSFVLKYTLIVLEISSLLFNKYYNDQKKNLTKKYSNNNMTGQPPDQIEKISRFLMNNFGMFNQVFFIVNVIKDIFADIAIIVIINVSFFLLNSSNLEE